jgi:hypothetical protein
MQIRDNAVSDLYKSDSRRSELAREIADELLRLSDVLPEFIDDRIGEALEDYREACRAHSNASNVFLSAQYRT